MRRASSPGSDLDPALADLVPALRARQPGHRPLVLGVCGAQGSGKSTLAGQLAGALAEAAGWRTAILGLDDFYLGRRDRQLLAVDVHPLLATRGVPGTHDVNWLGRTLDSLRAGTLDEPIPTFIKLLDDRAPESEWNHLSGRYDLVILEGWCIGLPPQSSTALAPPVNRLEAEQDPNGRWRRWVNDQLAGPYQALWSRLDALLFLAVPDIETVIRWRLDQEADNRKAVEPGAGNPMDEAAVRAFVAHYERLTRHALSVMPELADWTARLGAGHRVTRLSAR